MCSASALGPGAQIPFSHWRLTLNESDSMSPSTSGVNNPPRTSYEFRRTWRFSRHSDAKPSGTRCRFTLGVSKPLEPLALANHIERFKKYTNQNVVSEKFSHDSGRTNQNGVSIMPGRWLPSGYRLIEVQYCTWKRWKFFHETVNNFIGPHVRNFYLGEYDWLIASFHPIFPV